MPADLVAPLETLRDRLRAVRLGLATADAAAERTAGAVVDQVQDYLLPRLRSLDAPLLAVVGGSTGAGKSTLVNSVVGEQVTSAGVLRPTTRAPVLVCAEPDAGAFLDGRVLPGLPRVTGDDGGPGTLRIRTARSLPPGLALLDAPDVDSVVESNRELAGQLLAAADLWLFVTTAVRYADAVPWDLLRTAAERGTALAVVLDRVPPDAVDEVAGDLRGMLRDAGLPQARLFVIEERQLGSGRLPEDQVAPVRDWLHALAADAGLRSAVVRQTLVGALDSLDGRVGAVAAAVDRQVAAGQALRDAVTAAYRAAADEIDDGVRGGSLLRGEVLARWQEFVGTGEWMRGLEASIGRLRDRLSAVVTGRPTPADDLKDALEGSVERLVRVAADRAAERTVVAWRATPGGSGLLADPALERSSTEFAERVTAQVRAWQSHVLELVRTQGADRRTTARLLSFGVNGAGLAVMVAVFAHTGGLTGGEIAVAGGTSAVGQKLLEALFGDAAVRALAARAREDLAERIDRLLEGERARFTALVDAAAPRADTARELRAAVNALRAVRRPAA